MTSGQYPKLTHCLKESLHCILVKHIHMFIPCNAEFLRFVQNQEQCRKKWLEAGGAYKDLKDRIKQLESENGALQTRLKHARSVTVIIQCSIQQLILQFLVWRIFGEKDD